ncbi:hypothetical protein DPMN_067272 [Dreissena polymorpha]|uniref:Uncharacterized protein n=1 Tax=Dreissena polymorpha TaxID=45954 RepID=A0A9D4BTD7_DREPO|nr:hypothetical protein DPMN_067272 [Dreissena polymorpha]
MRDDNTDILLDSSTLRAAVISLSMGGDEHSFTFPPSVSSDVLDGDFPLACNEAQSCKVSRAC